MGYRSQDEYRRILRGGDIHTRTPQGNPGGIQPEAGPWPHAFVDSVRAERGTQGISILRKFSDWDPDRNWADALEPARGDAFKFGPGEKLTLLEGDAESASGGKSLAGTDFGELDTPRFRVRKGQNYQVRIVYRTTGSGGTAPILPFVYWYSDDQLTDIAVSSYPGFNLPKTNGVWTELIWYVTAPATAHWANLHIVLAETFSPRLDILKFEPMNEPVGQGTVFPTSPPTSARFYRTDRGIMYYFDGVRWLSVAEPILNLSAYATLLNVISATPISIMVAALPYSDSGQVYLTRWNIVTAVATPNDAGRFWTLKLMNNGGSVIDSFTTIPDGTGAVRRERGIGSVRTVGTDLYHFVQGVKTSTPGTLAVVGCNLHYRLIG